ncbi:helix-turn-helix transcriptional regulator [Pseudomonas gingeri]|uniref:helix-turn-helix transcriptional regulator n=1 Tax=Pseudomonas gingeri TaxID=117681 RepID=UPI0015A3CEAC|nr:DNA-binding protein [Pseudomonas gingeri]NWE28931.1 DNA-binding protein [Pseudomonas gingeri]NWE32523.1 DNA-binding protein [Pseudomonas gingeri]NWE54953.1 DNA-binding protein [Pseudomonas gingeri]NWE95057.1 DNA-binding protein [Pseudomonas gingeri]
MEYDFTLRYQLSEHNDDQDALIERLYECGCDDSLIGSGVPGRLALKFCRDAESAVQALLSALQDVKRAIPDARLIEVVPDLVGLSDIADIVGVSRQNMRKLMLGHGASFPLAVHEGSSSVWHLAEVLGWLEGRGYDLEPQMIETAQAAQDINLTKATSKLGAVNPEWLALVL